MDEMLAWNYNKNGIFLDDKKNQGMISARERREAQTKLPGCAIKLCHPRTEWAAESLKTPRGIDGAYRHACRLQWWATTKKYIYIFSIALSVIKQLVPLYKAN